MKSPTIIFRGVWVLSISVKDSTSDKLYSVVDEGLLYMQETSMLRLLDRWTTTPNISSYVTSGMTSWAFSSCLTYNANPCPVDCSIFLVNRSKPSIFISVACYVECRRLYTTCKKLFWICTISFQFGFLHFFVIFWCVFSCAFCRFGCN